MGYSNNIKSILETRPVYHQKDENIRGHVFCSFLALVLRKELDRRLERYGYCLSLNYFFATVQDQLINI